MGDRSRRYFVEADKLGGIPAKVRLASLARVTSAEAMAGPDDEATLKRLVAAFAKLRSELGLASDAPPPPTPSSPTTSTAPDSEAAKLRLHIASFADLMSQRALILSDTTDTARRVNEAASSVLGVARVSIWLLDDQRTKITCLDLFEAKARTHTAGLELFAKDYAPYFDAIATERSILAHDARRDPRTACFAQGYLEPLGITAMLDVPIWVRGRMAGVVCHEHVGSPRTWDADEERYGYLVSSFVALAMERTRAPMPSQL